MLAAVPPKDRPVVRLALHLTPQFTPYQHRTYAAMRWCEDRQRETDAPVDAIIAEAAKIFRVKSKSIRAAWLDKTSARL